MQFEGKYAIVHLENSNPVKISIFLPHEIWFKVSEFAYDIGINGIQYERDYVRNIMMSMFKDIQDLIEYTDFNKAILTSNTEFLANYVEIIRKCFYAYELNGLEYSDYNLLRDEISAKQQDIFLEQRRRRIDYFNTTAQSIRLRQSLNYSDIQPLLQQLSETSLSLQEKLQCILTDIWGFRKGVYKITNIHNGGFYIGEAGSRGGHIAKRWAHHISGLITKRHDNTRLVSEFLKFGLEAFQFEILEECDENRVLDKEQYYIETLQPHYNFLITTIGKQKIFVPWGFSRWESLLP